MVSVVHAVSNPALRAEKERSPQRNQTREHNPAVSSFSGRGLAVGGRSRRVGNVRILKKGER